MGIERPMNEYEGALFSAMMTLVKTVVELGADRAALAAKFRESAEVANRGGRESDAAVSEMLANLAERDVYYVPSLPFSVIKGGKGDSSN
jgi:chemotaxis receptor (MCP) glutamine deamidase CheD